MNFMGSEEFLLLMCHCEDRCPQYPPQHILTVPERIRLWEVGIRTAHEQPSWAMIEPRRGEYDFGYLGRIIGRNREAGLKSLIQICGWRVPSWIPADWRPRRADGIVETEVLSLWNEEAQQYSDNYYQMMVNNYRDEDDVAFFFGEYQGGEGIYPPTWCLYDEPALEDYKRVYGTSARPVPDSPETLEWYGNKAVEHVQHKQVILQPRWNEVWNSQQHLMDRWTKAFGNFVQDKIMLAHRKAWPDVSLVLCQATYFDDSHTKEEHDDVDRIIALTGCETLVEAMFPKGLPTTTPKAIAKGFRGQLVHAAHELDQKAIEDWEVQNIKHSHEQWMKHYEAKDHVLQP